MDGSGRPHSLRSGELARLTGVSLGTLRHYERKRLLMPSRSENGYREYSPASVECVQTIQRALSVGFTLVELSQVLSIRDQGGAPCGRVRANAGAKLEDLERQMAEIVAPSDELQSLLKIWDLRFAETLAGQQARLLDAWPAESGSLSQSRPALSQRWTGPKKTKG